MKFLATAFLAAACLVLSACAATSTGSEFPAGLKAALQSGKSVSLVPEDAVSAGQAEDRGAFPPKRICSLKCETFNECDNKGKCRPSRICFRECGDI